MNCPFCDKKMEHQDCDPSTGIAGGWHCEECDKWISDSEIDYSDELYDTH